MYEWEKTSQCCYEEDHYDSLHLNVGTICTATAIVD